MPSQKIEKFYRVDVVSGDKFLIRPGQMSLKFLSHFRTSPAAVSLISMSSGNFESALHHEAEPRISPAQPSISSNALSVVSSPSMPPQVMHETDSHVHNPQGSSCNSFQG